MTRRAWLALAASSQISVHDEIREASRVAPLSLAFQGSTAGDCRAWQKRFSEKLRDLLGPFDPPVRWETVVESTEDVEGVRRQSLVLKAAGIPDLPVYLLTPAGESTRWPAVLALHGHGAYGHDPVAGVAASVERRKNLAEHQYDYGFQLARQGYVVAAPCFTPFGRRLGDPVTYGRNDPCAVTFVRLQLLGRVLMAENLRDALWALELLARQRQVDAARMGCVGLSYGGRMTMLTAALSARVKVAVISGALNVMQERIEGAYSCGAQVIPGLLRYGDVPEISSLIAPRPCLFEVGRQDALMVKDRLEPALARMRRAWRAFGAEDQLQVDSFDGGHRWNGVVAYPVLRRVL